MYPAGIVSIGLRDNAIAYLSALFYRLTAFGNEETIVAVAHQILVTDFSAPRDESEYQELGGDFFDQQHPQRTQNRLVRSLEKLGLQVVITAAKHSLARLRRAAHAVAPVNVSNAELTTNTSG